MEDCWTVERLEAPGLSWTLDLTESLSLRALTAFKGFLPCRPRQNLPDVAPVTDPSEESRPRLPPVLSFPLLAWWRICAVTSRSRPGSSSPVFALSLLPTVPYRLHHVRKDPSQLYIGLAHSRHSRVLGIAVFGCLRPLTHQK